MRILIAGAGEAGVHLAKILSTENFDVVVIDPDAGRLETLNGYDLLTVAADPLSGENLLEAGVAKTDMFVSLMPSDSENILMAIMAKELGANCTAARINRDSLDTPSSHELLKRKGVDYLIYPERLAVEEVAEALRHPWSRHWSALCEGHLIIAAAPVTSKSVLCNIVLKDFAHRAADFHVSAVTRGRETIIPNGNTIIQNGDIAYITTTADKESEVGSLFGCCESHIHKIMIVGGSRIGEMAAHNLSKHYNILLVEKNAQRAQILSETMPQNAIVANGDGRSIEFLESESIDGFDAYLAFTESSEGNIIGCQIARESGVSKTVVTTNSIDLVAEAEKLGINTVINKNLLCSGRIRQILLDSSENQCMSLAGANVTVVSVTGNLRVCHSMIKDLNFPKGVTIAGVIRDGQGLVVNGQTQLQIGDRVALFMLQGTLLKIKQLFS